MLFNTSQRELLRLILTEIQEHVQYDDTSLDNIGFYVLDHTRSSLLPNDIELEQSLAYLRELQEVDGLQSLQAIWGYLEERRQHARCFVIEMIDRVDRQRLSGKLD
jgi:hypothetical protein